MLKEGRRAPGSEWFKNHPRLLERAYKLTLTVFSKSYPVMKRVSPTLALKLVTRGEEIAKGYLFNCQMCGQCVLHSTGMTCPMTCPKNLRNGPCGGVRANGHCEVKPEMKCVWVLAYEGGRRMPGGVEAMRHTQLAIDHRLQGSSSWLRVVREKTGEPA
jgi:hypothetical protein